MHCEHILRQLVQFKVNIFEINFFFLIKFFFFLFFSYPPYSDWLPFILAWYETCLRYIIYHSEQHVELCYQCTVIQLRTWTDKFVLYGAFISMSESGEMHSSKYNIVLFWEMPTHCHSLQTMLVTYLLKILDISRAVIYFTAFRVNIVQPVPTNCKLVTWCSMMFSDAEALLFQSAERELIDVESIHVATNEMEEILQLLTGRDIQQTNNPPLLVPSPTHILQSPDVHSSLTPSIFLCLSLRLS